MDFRAWFNGVKLDLLDLLRVFIGGTLLGDFGGSSADAGVGGIDVVKENFLGVMIWCCDTKRVSSACSFENRYCARILPLEKKAHAVSAQRAAVLEEKSLVHALFGIGSLAVCLSSKSFHQ